jgi:hypothetical protein
MVSLEKGKRPIGIIGDDNEKDSNRTKGNNKEG